MIHGIKKDDGTSRTARGRGKVPPTYIYNDPTDQVKWLTAHDNHRSIGREPERTLLIAMLELAVKEYLWAKKPHLKQAAREWIYNEDMDAEDDWLFTFDNVCQYLGIHPDYFRKGLEKSIGNKQPTEVRVAKLIGYSQSHRISSRDPNEEQRLRRARDRIEKQERERAERRRGTEMRRLRRKIS